MSLLLTKLSKLDTFLEVYEAASSMSLLTGKTIFQHVLENLDISVESDLSKVPFSTRGCIVISNHPTGPLDGVLIGAFLDKYQVEYKIVANTLLSKLEKLQNKFIFVCVEPKTSRDVAENASSIRRIIEFIKFGGCCVIFPSGEVEGSNPSAWNTTIGYLARSVKCTLVPMYIHEKCSLTFRISMLFGRNCRIFCLPRQLLVKRHKTIRLTIGPSIEAWALRDLFSNEQMTNFLRNKVVALSHE
jgi:putative hemolysin